MLQGAPEHEHGLGHLEEHFGDFQSVLNVLDEIRNMAGDNDGSIKIPTVAVVGDQSHGKSSLMELISGIDLPRASGICTKVPLELRLRECNDVHREHAIVIAADSIGFQEHISMSQVSEKILSLTRSLLDDCKQLVADRPITLTIYADNLPNLTMIDLPGLVHNDDSDKKIEVLIHPLTDILFP